MRRIVFTAPLGLASLQPELTLNRDVPAHASSWIANLSRAFPEKADIDLHIITVSSLVARSQTVRKFGMTHHILSTQLPMVRRGLGLAGAHALYAWPIARMLARIERLDPDLVHGHGCEGPFSIAALASRRPCVISLQGIMSEIVKVDPTVSNRISARLERLTVRCARHVNIKSNFSRQFVDQLRGFGGRTYFIEPAINSLFWTRPQPAPACRVYFVGSVMERKGVEDLVEAVRQLVPRFPELRVSIIGSGVTAYVEYLAERIADAGLDRVIELTGGLAHGEIHERLQSGGVFCLPSHIENSPNTIMEAMAMALPVVATNVGDVCNIVSSGETGVVVPTHDPAGLAEGLERILGNPAFAKSAGSRGREAANLRWKPEVIAEKHLEMYDAVLEDDRRRGSGGNTWFPLSRLRGGAKR